MNQLSNLNAKVFKEVVYNASLLPTATTLNFTVENCSTNAYIEQIIIYLAASDPNFYSQTNLSLLDRGNGYTGSINGFQQMTFATIGTSSLSSPVYATSSQTVSQSGNTIIFDVFQSVEDSEGCNNIYVQLNRLVGTFNVGFTMVVVYRPEITYNTKLNTRNQTSFSKYFRVLSQSGTAPFSLSTSSMIDQTKNVINFTNPRNNTDILSNGFNVDTNNPYFYFGLPTQNKRWFLGFSSDNSPGLGIVTFSYYNGTSFQGFAATQIFNGCQGPGTYKFANDGIVIFTPPPTWQSLQMANDPLTKYNNVIIGLGQTLATNNIVSNPMMYWIQAQVGFIGVNTLTISTVVPLIDPAQPITNRRPLI